MSSPRRGYTLFELLVAMASAGVLMVGLSSALYVATKAMQLDEGGSAVHSRSDQALARLLGDVRTATQLRVLTSTAVEFDTPDRTGDGAADTLRYEWGGDSGDPLTRTLNGGAALTVLPDVRSLAFGSLESSVTAPDVSGEPLTTWPIVVAGEAPSMSENVRNLSLPVPSGVVAGDLLIAVMAVEDGGAGNDSVNPAGAWTEIDFVVLDDSVRLGAWCMTVSNSTAASYQFSWSGERDAIGWILAIANHDPSTPIQASGVATAMGDSSAPVCPSAWASDDDSLVLRLGVFERNGFDTTDVTGLSGHTDVWARNLNSNLSAGCAYLAPASSGSTGTASFDLNNADEYITMTVVVAPRERAGE